MVVKLYVHGTPQGNQTWGNVQGYDKQYIDCLYGGSIKKVEADVQMWVEVQENRDLGKKVCYYTYYRKDTLEYGTARSGGYFALTLRLDCYYSYVSNIYSLLDAVFNSFIVGQILDKKGGSFQYKITNFESHQAKKGYELGAIEEEIKKYLLTFSSDNNILDLKDFNTSRNSQITTENLCDCKPEEMTSHIRQYGLVSISPLHPTVAIANLKQELSNKEQLYWQKGQQEITELRNTIENKDQQIRSISNAKSTIEQEKLNVSAQLEKTNKLIENIRNLLSVKELKTTKLENPNEEKSDDSDIQEKKTSHQLRRKLHLIKETGVLIILSVILLRMIMQKSCTKDSSCDKENTQISLIDSIARLNSSIAMLNEENNELKEKKDKAVKEVFDQRYPNAIIDIMGISNGRMHCGKSYWISLKNVDRKLEGSFLFDDTPVLYDSFTPDQKGVHIISYVIDGVKVIERTVKVED